MTTSHPWLGGQLTVDPRFNISAPLIGIRSPALLKLRECEPALPSIPAMQVALRLWRSRSPLCTQLSRHSLQDDADDCYLVSRRPYRIKDPLSMSELTWVLEIRRVSSLVANGIET